MGAFSLLHFIKMHICWMKQGLSFMQTKEWNHFARAGSARYHLASRDSWFCVYECIAYIFAICNRVPHSFHFFSHHRTWLGLDGHEKDLMLHTNGYLSARKFSFPMSSLVHCTEKKEGLDCYSSMARVIVFHCGPTESWQCQTHQGATTSTSPIIIIFPNEQHSSMGPEIGLHL